MSTTYKNQMNDSFTITKEFQAAAHYGTGIEQQDLVTANDPDSPATWSGTAVPAIAAYTTYVDSAAALALATVTAALPVGQKFTIVNKNVLAARTLTFADNTVFDCNGTDVVIGPGESVTFRATGLATCEIVSTTGDWA